MKKYLVFVLLAMLVFFKDVTGLNSIDVLLSVVLYCFGFAFLIIAVSLHLQEKETYTEPIIENISYFKELYYEIDNIFSILFQFISFLFHLYLSSEYLIECIFIFSCYLYLYFTMHKIEKRRGLDE